LSTQRTFQAIARWASRYLILGIAAITPGVVAYALLARAVGTDNLLAGVSGYGILARVCPLWPNGLGLFGAISAVGLAAAVIAALSVFYIRPGPRRRARTLICLAIASVGALLWAYHLRFALNDFRGSQPTLSGFRLLASYCLSMSGFLSPFMWSGIVLLLFLIVRIPRSMRAGGLSMHESSLLLVSIPLALLASRGMFGSMLGNATAVHQAAYSLMIPFACYLVLYAQEIADAASSVHGAFRLPALPSLWATPNRRAWALLAIVSGAFTLPRVVKEVARPPTQALDTPAGRVHLMDPLSRAAFEYVSSHTRPTDRILELPNAGGMSFALGRLPTTYSTQFSGLRTPQRLMHLDAELVRAHPPALVLTYDNPNLGAMFGLCAPIECTFPRFVWRPDHMACDPAQRFEAVEFVRANYEPRAHFGAFVVLSPRSSS
jgi:hypothetical protein